MVGCAAGYQPVVALALEIRYAIITSERRCLYPKTGYMARFASSISMKTIWLAFDSNEHYSSPPIETNIPPSSKLRSVPLPPPPLVHITTCTEYYGVRNTGT